MYEVATCIKLKPDAEMERTASFYWCKNL